MEFVPYKDDIQLQTQLNEENQITIGRGFDTRVIGWLVPVKANTAEVFA
jgi:hypothetical protein